MGTVAQTLSTIAPQAQHNGSCCALRRFLSSADLDDDDRAAIREVIAGPLPPREVSGILAGVGLPLSDQRVYAHRRGLCRCCEVHGG